MPEVSVIVPTKDRWSSLLDTIRSVREQTLSELELIVVDDGSTDETAQGVKALMRADGRLRYVPSAAHPRGPSGSRNEGAKIAASPLLVFLDSDDFLKPSCLEIRVREMKSDASLDFAAFLCEIFSRHRGDVKRLLNVPTKESDLHRTLRFEILWQTMGVIWRREALQKIGGWNEGLPVSNDWELFARALVEGCKYRWLDIVDCEWRYPAAGRPSVASTPRDARTLQSREEALVGILEKLESRKALSEEARLCAAINYFEMAEGWRQSGKSNEAAKAWERCRSRGLLSTRAYWEGKIYLLLPRGRNAFRKYLAKAWPMRPGYSATYCSVPVSEKVGRTSADKMSEKVRPTF